MLQRVSRAEVRVADESVARVAEGLLALVGVGHADGPEDALELARKIVHLRIFEDSEGRMNRSLLETGGDLAVVSQFTLYADCRKGRRPSFGEAAAPEQAEPLIESLVAAARAEGVTVATGRFRSTMSVSLCNEGPVTVILDTEKRI